MDSDETMDQDPLLEVPYVQWMGDPVDAMPPASALLAEWNRSITTEDWNNALVFYAGEQWPAGIRNHRDGRPTLTMNRLPLLVAAAIAADPEMALKPGREYSQNQQDALTRLKVIITLRNMDAQKLYNFMSSQVADMMAATGKPRAGFHRDAFALVWPPLGTEPAGTTEKP